MGLDSAEIIMELEDSFGIEFTEDDWAAMGEYREMTVANLCEFVQQKVHLEELGRTHVRLNVNLWNEMRRLLHSATGVPLDEIRLATELETLFPRTTRAVGWQTLRNLSIFRIRELDYPADLKSDVGWCLFLCGFVVPLILLSSFIFSDFSTWGLLLCAYPLLLPVWGIALGYTYEHILKRLSDLRQCFPNEIHSVKTLCRSVREGNYSLLCHQVGIVPLPIKVDLWSPIRKILSEQLSVPADEIKPESRLIQDLGMD